MADWLGEVIGAVTDESGYTLAELPHVALESAAMIADSPGNYYYIQQVVEEGDWTIIVHKDRQLLH